MKKALAVTLTLALVLTLSLALFATAAEGEWDYVYVKNADTTFLAFQPKGGFVEGQAYTLDVQVKSTGAEGFRVRVNSAPDWGSNIDGDIVNKYPTLSADGVVSPEIKKLPAWLPHAGRTDVTIADDVVVPAITTPVITNGATTTLKFDFTFTKAEVAAAIDYWALITGDGGNPAWEVVSFDGKAATVTPDFDYVYKQGDPTFFAFQPIGGFVEGKSYTARVQVKSTGVEGFRIRVNGAADYASNIDGDIVNNYPTLGEDGVVGANIANIPAWLPTIAREKITVNDVEMPITTPVVKSGGTATLVFDFTFTKAGLAAADDYWAVVTGDQGNHDFEVIAFNAAEVVITPDEPDGPDDPPPDAPPAPPVAANESLINWSAEIAAFMSGGSDTTWIKNSGDFTTKSLSGTTLKIAESSRDNYASDYCVIDIILENQPNLIPGEVYTLVVSYSTPDDNPLPFRIGQGYSPYNTLVGPVEGTRATLTYKFTAGEARNARLQLDAGNNKPFNINRVALYHGDPPETDASSLVFYAIGALALTGGGATFAAIKLRKGKREE